MLGFGLHLPHKLDLLESCRTQTVVLGYVRTHFERVNQNSHVAKIEY